MVRLAAIVIIFTALMAGVAANAQNDGGYIAPELSKPTPGRLLDRGSSDVDRRDRPTAGGSAGVGSNAARPLHRAAE